MEKKSENHQNKTENRQLISRIWLYEVAIPRKLWSQKLLKPKVTTLATFVACEQAPCASSESRENHARRRESFIAGSLRAWFSFRRSRMGPKLEPARRLQLSGFYDHHQTTFHRATFIPLDRVVRGEPVEAPRNVRRLFTQVQFLEWLTIDVLYLYSHLKEHLMEQMGMDEEAAIKYLNVSIVCRWSPHE